LDPEGCPFNASIQNINNCIFLIHSSLHRCREPTSGQTASWPILFRFSPATTADPLRIKRQTKNRRTGPVRPIGGFRNLLRSCLSHPAPRQKTSLNQHTLGDRTLLFRGRCRRRLKSAGRAARHRAHTFTTPPFVESSFET
jgi:hypothetical protein